MTLDELADLLLLCAAHPEPYELSWISPRPGFAFAWAAGTYSAFKDEENRAAITALCKMANAAPALLTLLTTQPRLSPDLAAALDKMTEVYALFDSQSDPAFYEIARTALIGWAVRAIDAYRAAKGEPTT